jgi:hypothetical protein
MEGVRQADLAREIKFLSPYEIRKHFICGQDLFVCSFVYVFIIQETD